MEIRKQLIPVQVDYQCPKCKKGYLRSTGVVLPSYPAQYPHECYVCGYGETFLDKSYPYIEYDAAETKKQ